MPLNQQIGSSEMYEGTEEIAILPTEQIKVETGGSCDYDFNITGK